MSSYIHFFPESFTRSQTDLDGRVRSTIEMKVMVIDILVVQLNQHSQSKTNFKGDLFSKIYVTVGGMK
jgi:hypothetical protein